MSYRSRGFTLIELMIVITIIGILASLAVSAYQTYTVRAQISEGLNFAAGAKVPIVDAYTNGGIAPANRVAAGMTPMPTDTRGSYVTSVANRQWSRRCHLRRPTGTPGHHRHSAFSHAL